MIVLLAFHIAAAVVWVGGMFFAYAVLRPSVGPLDAPVRLGLWRRVFGRFFAWVLASIAALLVSGYGMVFGYLGGFKGVGVHVHVMQATGIVMMLAFFHLYFAPWRRFRAAVEKGDFATAGANLNQIRMIVAFNLVLGAITVLVGSTGRYWG
jgi:uncharacterized membrane protein